METTACPSCGRAFPVRTRAMHACPGCGRPLDADPVVSRAIPPPWLADPATPGVAPGPDGPVAAVETDPSVRPPTVEVDPDRDPLAGWDLQAPRAPIGSAGPSDWVVVLAATLAGVLVGGAIGRAERTGRTAVAGALVGLVVAAVRLRVWVIDPPDATWARRLHN